MESESIEATLRATEDQLREWLERFGKAQDAVPFVSRSLEVVHWERQALDNLPEEARRLQLPYTADYYRRRCDYLAGTLPRISDYDVDSVRNFPAVLTSGTVNYYGFLDEVADLQTPASQTYADTQKRTYSELQTRQMRIHDVRSLLCKLGSKRVLSQFERAFRAHSADATKTGARTAAAIEMRTLLDGVQGELFARAGHQRGQKTSWLSIAMHFAKGEPCDITYQKVVEEGQSREKLIGQLSLSAKDRDESHPVDLDAVWTETLDHIYTVLSLVRL